MFVPRALLNVFTDLLHLIINQFLLNWIHEINYMNSILIILPDSGYQIPLANGEEGKCFCISPVRKSAD